MKLSALFPYGDKKTKDQNAGTAASRDSLPVRGEGRPIQDNRGLIPGQTLQGEVVGREGSEVQIRTAQDMIITARLEREMVLAMGQSLTFEIKSNSQGQVALRPLFENMAHDANILKALAAAKLPASQDMVLMVTVMMDRGMSIDKNSLLEMGRLINANPGKDPELIVLLKNLGLPVTEENLEQIGRYKNLEHQLLSDMKGIVDKLPDTFQQMVSSGHLHEGINLYQQILHVLGSGQAWEGIEPGSGQAQTAVAEGKVVTILPAGLEGETGIFFEKSGEKAFPLPETLPAAPGMPKEALEQTMAPRMLGEVLPGSGREEIAGVLEKMGLPKELVQQVKSGSIPVSVLLPEIAQLMQAHRHSSDTAPFLETLLTGKGFQQLLKKEFMDQWLISPQDVESKEKVAELYRKLGDQTARLAQVAEQAAKGSPLSKSLTTVQNNIQFINQLNQMFQYLQLPLKMTEGNANGELYVYKRRGRSLKEEDSVTALLHLDMEHLGSLDVHIAMNGNNVSTKFYLQDDKTIDFLSEHIHVLDERLREKGYAMESQMIRQETASRDSVIDEMSKEENRSQALSHYSFDVRA